MKFDLLEIQKNIEEKRLILGKRFENFLLKKSTILLIILAGFLLQKILFFIFA